ncbi:hypothetical protein B0H19DRAFT_1234715 [Mycena capillaripes]|nr:hypothetical protein B0H19DRAFT_1234715 [Mycena capillaripes]
MAPTLGGMWGPFHRSEDRPNGSYHRDSLARPKRRGKENRGKEQGGVGGRKHQGDAVSDGGKYGGRAQGRGEEDGHEGQDHEVKREAGGGGGEELLAKCGGRARGKKEERARRSGWWEECNQKLTSSRSIIRSDLVPVEVPMRRELSAERVRGLRRAPEMEEGRRVRDERRELGGGRRDGGEARRAARADHQRNATLPAGVVREGVSIADGHETDVAVFAHVHALGRGRGWGGPNLSEVLVRRFERHVPRIDGWVAELRDQKTTRCKALQCNRCPLERRIPWDRGRVSARRLRLAMDGGVGDEVDRCDWLTA